jgi:hypothetical protein
VPLHSLNDDDDDVRAVIAQAVAPMAPHLLAAARGELQGLLTALWVC